MPLQDIQLDDRRFEQLVADAKRRIPGYTPEWTDLNDSDPGMALVQLFAWLTEMILWRLNRVPEKNYVKFLELIGIELNAPVPARVELTFNLTTTDPPGGVVLIPQGTQVALAEAANGAVIFESDDNLYAVGAKISALQSFDGAQFQVLTEANRVSGKYFFPLSTTPRKHSAFYLGFEGGFPKDTEIALTIHAFTGDIIEEGGGIKADDRLNFDESADPTSGHASEPLHQSMPPVLAFWEYWAGDTLKWQRLNLKDDTTSSLTRSGKVSFLFERSDPDMQLTKLGLLRKPDDKALYWLRYRIEELLGAGYEIPPRIEDVLLNTIWATNASSVKDELLGASDGSANQVFRLSKTPALPDGFDLHVNEGEGFQSWTRVRDFAGSKREDRHFTLNFATGEVAFGDGTQGKIPERLVENPDRPEEDVANIKVATYRSGGGARGNAGAKKITSLESPVPYVDTVTNLRASEGGEDEETIADAKLRAPEVIRSRSRAVTAGDFEFLARQTPGARIRRARALPLHHPQLEPTRPAGANLPVTTVPVPGVVTVIVVPEALPRDPKLGLPGNRKPMPTAETLGLVARWLNQHRLITTELFVVAPKYRRVEIEARVKVSPTASSAQVELDLEEMLLAYFHPLTGGPDGKGWEFGGTIYFSETYRRILNTPGVELVESGAVKTYVDGKLIDPCADFPLGQDELVYSLKHKLFVSYA